ncbi:MAG TPA: hypothetical protein VG125_26505 [Pirellulales bacterium]|jgi:hypothetical protein|nr:hypothetical protein [Pirellulales bacterium]
MRQAERPQGWRLKAVADETGHADFLFQEIGPRLARGPARLGVVVQLAGDGDDVTVV